MQAFAASGADPDYAQQCWYAYTTAVLGWIVAEHNPALSGTTPMRFDALLQILLRGTAPLPGS